MGARLKLSVKWQCDPPTPSPAPPAPASCAQATIFAPTNAAFQSALSRLGLTAAQALAPANQTTLLKVGGRWVGDGWPMGMEVRVGCMFRGSWAMVRLPALDISEPVLCSGITAPHR